MRRLYVLCYESSVQLSYQNSRIMLEYLYPNILGMDYSSYGNPRMFWISSMVLQAISLFFSGMSTMGSILKYETLQSYRRKSPAHWSVYIIKLLQVMTHILMGTLGPFLLEFHGSSFGGSTSEWPPVYPR